MPCFCGAHPAADITLRSAVKADLFPEAATATEYGAVAEAAHGDKKRTYPEFLRGRCCRMIAVCTGNGGR